jgi:hypothetical protein
MEAANAAWTASLHLIERKIHTHYRNRMRRWMPRLCERWAWVCVPRGRGSRRMQHVSVLTLMWMLVDTRPRARRVGTVGPFMR